MEEQTQSTTDPQPQKKSFFKRPIVLITGSGLLFCCLLGIIGVIFLDEEVEPNDQSSAITDSQEIDNSEGPKETRSEASEIEKTQEETSIQSPEPTETPSPSPEPIPGIGDAVQVGDVIWTVLNVENLGNTILSNNQFIDDLETTGKFIKVDFDIENTGDESRSLSGTKVIDSLDREYSNSSDAWQIFQESIECSFLEDIRPGIPQSCMFIFEVSEQSSGIKMAVGDLKLLGEPDKFIQLTKLDETLNTEDQETIGQEAQDAEEVGIGESILVGDVIWQVSSVEDLGSIIKSDNQFVDDLETRGKFLRVNFTIENISNEELTLSGTSVVDDAEREFEYTSDAWSILSESVECSFLEPIRPNISQNCMLIFEIASDSANLKMIVTDLKFFGGPSKTVRLYE